MGWDGRGDRRERERERERGRYLPQLGEKGMTTISHASKFDGRFVHATRAPIARRGRGRGRGREAEGVCINSLRHEVIEEHLAISHGQSRLDPSRVASHLVWGAPTAHRRLTTCDMKFCLHAWFSAPEKTRVHAMPYHAMPCHFTRTGFAMFLCRRMTRRSRVLSVGVSICAPTDHKT